jgi:hypothetical protein
LGLFLRLAPSIDRRDQPGLRQQNHSAATSAEYSPSNARDECRRGIGFERLHNAQRRDAVSNKRGLRIDRVGQGCFGSVEAELGQRKTERAVSLRENISRLRIDFDRSLAIPTNQEP